MSSMSGEVDVARSEVDLARVHVRALMEALEHIVASQRETEDYDCNAIARAATLATASIINLSQAERVLALANKITEALS